MELRVFVKQKVMKKFSSDRGNLVQRDPTLSFEAFDWPWAVEIVPRGKPWKGVP
jgi:hypothetical protein